jgi:hypothetical protein
VYYKPPENITKKDSLNVSKQHKRSYVDPTRKKSRFALKRHADDESDESENSLPDGLLTLADRNNSQFKEFMSDIFK